MIHADIAELRSLLSASLYERGNDDAFVFACRDTLPVILDELEASREGYVEARRKAWERFAGDVIGAVADGYRVTTQSEREVVATHAAAIADAMITEWEKRWGPKKGSSDTTP